MGWLVQLGLRVPPCAVTEPTGEKEGSLVEEMRLLDLNLQHHGQSLSEPTSSAVSPASTTDSGRRAPSPVGLP